MSLTLDTSEVHALAADIRHNADETTPQVQRVIEDTAHDVDETYEQLVPKDTHFLEHSESATVGNLSFEAGPTARYGGYVELGTSDTPAQPALGPAFDIHELRATERIASIGGAILE